MNNLEKNHRPTWQQPLLYLVGGLGIWKNIWPCFPEDVPENYQWISGWWFGNMIFSDFPYINQREHRAISSKVRSCRSMISNQHLVGVLEHEFYDFPYVGNSNPDWRTHIFQRGWSTTNQIIMVLDPHQQYYCSLVVDDCFSLGGLFASFRMVFHVVSFGCQAPFFYLVIEEWLHWLLPSKKSAVREKTQCIESGAFANTSSQNGDHYLDVHSSMANS